MSLTLSIRSTIETAERLARNTLSKFYSSWNVIDMNDRLLSVAYNTILNLNPATTYFISCDPLATISVGWILNSQIIEIPVNGFTIINPPNAPYLRNTSLSSTSNPVPVKVISISNTLQTTDVSTISGMSLIVTDNLTVPYTNTISNLSQLYNGQFAILMINGQSFACSPTSNYFSISGTSVSWNASNAGFPLQPSDNVQMVYTTFANSGQFVSTPTFSSVSVTVSSTDTFAALTYPYDGILATLVVNGQSISFGSGFFSLSGTALTWHYSVAGYHVNTSDIVTLLYTH